jgi:NTP pyrophosphatase (non-canonical NTP hydrolase)
MNMKHYQSLAHTTSLNTKIGNDTLAYPVLGLANEAGEVAGKLKKLYRDKNGIVDDDFRDMMIGELGDVLWYLAETCSQLNITLDLVAKENLSKLFSRMEKGTIKGNGDKR